MTYFWHFGIILTYEFAQNGTFLLAYHTIYQFAQNGTFLTKSNDSPRRRAKSDFYISLRDLKTRIIRNFSEVNKEG